MSRSRSGFAFGLREAHVPSTSYKHAEYLGLWHGRLTKASILLGMGNQAVKSNRELKVGLTCSHLQPVLFQLPFMEGRKFRSGISRAENKRFKGLRMFYHL